MVFGKIITLELKEVFYWFSRLKSHVLNTIVFFLSITVVKYLIWKAIQYNINRALQILTQIN